MRNERPEEGSPSQGSPLVNKLVFKNKRITDGNHELILGMNQRVGPCQPIKHKIKLKIMQNTPSKKDLFSQHVPTFYCLSLTRAHFQTLSQRPVVAVHR